jgi:hypothetical protein
VEERPVFIQFNHSTYQPQFYPSHEGDERARSRKYLAVGEEWISEHALDQLGLVAKAKKDGRVFLEATVTWVRTLKGAHLSLN